MDQQRKVVISELLFDFQNKHGAMPFLNLQNMLVGFFREEEVRGSQIIPYDFANSMYDEKEIDRCVKRLGNDRKKLDVSNIVHLFELLDQKKVVFPVFVATNISRIPGIKPLESDILALSASVNELKTQVHYMSSSFNMLQSKINGNFNTVKSNGSKDSTLNYSANS